MINVGTRLGLHEYHIAGIEWKHGGVRIAVLEISEPELEYVPRDVPTETAAIAEVRSMQSLFRKVVLAAYNSKRCITGNPVEDLLVASHILPWSDFPIAPPQSQEWTLPGSSLRQGV